MFVLLPLKLASMGFALYGALKLAGAGKAIPLFVAGKMATAKYRPGEGPLSEKTIIEIAKDDPVGEMLFVLGDYKDDFKKFRGRTLRVTNSEKKSLMASIEAISTGSTEPLLDFLEQFPRW